ncbi:VOC family protein [Tianweitania sediminis]|uniref:VOC family protein n=1 Tax=Tianweitania sediminis TaxID=1502156 RepID=UPI003158EA18
MRELTSSSTPMRIGKVSLTVRDLPLVSGFYQRVLGMKVVQTNGSTVALGAGNHALLELVSEPDADLSSRNDAGLFHTAFLLPVRADLGRWINFAAENRVAIGGASDHAVSEALYLNDPEGNGIEIYVDRPASDWPYVDGSLQMVTEALDIGSLRAAAGSKPWDGLPVGSVIGHVHLRVGDIPTAEVFYSDTLGFDITARYPGASFYGSGGYHHHLAGNIWNSRGAQPRETNATGLRDVEILVRDDALLDATRSRLGHANAVTHADSSFTVRDRWNAALTFRRG